MSIYTHSHLKPLSREFETLTERIKFIRSDDGAEDICSKMRNITTFETVVYCATNETTAFLSNNRWTGTITSSGIATKTSSSQFNYILFRYNAIYIGRVDITSQSITNLYSATIENAL